MKVLPPLRLKRPMAHLQRPISHFLNYFNNKKLYSWFFVLPKSIPGVFRAPKKYSVNTAIFPVTILEVGVIFPVTSL